jgi:hypothetical protein
MIWLFKNYYIPLQSGRELFMIEEHLFALNIFGDYDDSAWMATEPIWRGIAVELEELHYLKGASFIKQLKQIVYYGEFHPVEGETDIYSTGGEQSPDYKNLLNVAHKAVEHGCRVFILPNPKGTRTPDFIFEQKGNFKIYDLKTISGKNSVSNRLFESIGQSNRVLLNMTVDYNIRLLASDIKSYFETNQDALEVLIFKGKKEISIDRYFTLSPQYHKLFRKRYEK